VVSRLSAYELSTGKAPRWKPSDLIEFGRVGIVKIKDKHVKNGEEKGLPMVMVGYAVDSPTGTYRFYNPKIKRIISLDSVTWSDFKRWVISEELSGIYEEAKSMNKPGIPSYDEEGILIGEGIPDPASGNAQKQQQQPQAESEYKNLSSGGREMKFQQMLLEEIAFVETPGILLEDNEGCE